MEKKHAERTLVASNLDLLLARRESPAAGPQSCLDKQAFRGYRWARVIAQHHDVRRIFEMVSKSLLLGDFSVFGFKK